MSPQWFYVVRITHFCFCFLPRRGTFIGLLALQQVLEVVYSWWGVKGTGLPPSSGETGISSREPQRTETPRARGRHPAQGLASPAPAEPRKRAEGRPGLLCPGGSTPARRDSISGWSAARPRRPRGRCGACAEGTRHQRRSNACAGAQRDMRHTAPRRPAAGNCGRPCLP